MRDEQLLLVRELRAVAGAIEAAGLDIRQVTSEAGLPCLPEEMRDEYISTEQLKCLWEAAARISGDVTIALAVGDNVPFGAYEVVDYLGLASDSVGGAMREVARYFALITRAFSWQLDCDGDPVRIVLAPGDGAPPDASLGAQYSLGVTFGRFKRYADGELRFACVELAMPEPHNRARHEAFFRCPIRYGCADFAVFLPRSSWDLPMSRREPALQRLLARHAEQLLASQPAPGDPLTPVRVAIRQTLGKGDATIQGVARRVAMSARTLQRRLRDGGTTFHALVEQERSSIARAYLADRKLAIGEVAYMLGYSEASAFVRAFKRWTGKTPGDYRLELA